MAKKKEDQTPIGKIEPKQVPASEAKARRPDHDAADEASPVQTSPTHEKGMFGSAAESVAAHTESIFITDDDMPVHKHYILFGIAFFITAFVLWANWATLDEVTRGNGKIIPSSENKTLQSLEGGIVEEFLTREGMRVAEGDVILRLKDVQASSDLGSNEQRYLGILAAVTRLQAEVEGLASPEFPEEVIKKVPQSVTEELNAFKANRDRLQSQSLVLEQQLSQREQEVNEITTRISDTRRLLSLAREEKNMIAPLVEKGSAPRLELLQLDRSIQERKTELNGLTTSLPRAESAVDEAEAKLKELKDQARAEAQTELTTRTVELNSLKETLSALEDRKTRTDIVSPVDGIIKDLLVNTVGGVVQPGADIVEIVPMDENLLVEARVRPGDIAFLHPGMKAVVKITAYDYSIYGGLNGELVDISADTIKDEQGEDFYRVRIKTYESELKRKDQVLPIIPGMVASVDILTGEKTVMEYILKPLIKTLDNAMNER